MEVHEANEVQAEFWTNAGAMWTVQRDRFDAQVHEHGLAAMDALEPAPGESVVDVGCGAGTTTLQLAERVGPDGHVLGLDISPTMIEGARALAAEAGATNVSFAVGDATVHPFGADADAVYSRFGLMFFADAAAGFRNLCDALRPGGRLGFVCWQAPALNSWASRTLQAASRYVEIPFGDDPTAPGPFSLAGEERLRSLLDEAGFVDLAIESEQRAVHLGSEVGDAVDFLFDLIPPVAALEESEPEAATALRADLTEILTEWQTGTEVAAPSASWVVTARRPG